jgi:hypothetical protein
VVGDLALVAPIISHSIQNGINSSPLAGGDANRSLSVSDGLIAHNGANGIYLLAHARLDLERNRICSNTGADRTLAGNTRKVGGVYCQGNAPTGLVFKGNRIQDNGGDQVLVGASANAWNVSGEAGCSDATTNVLMGLTTGVGLAALGAPVTAKFMAWSSNAGPILNTDYRAISSTIDVGSVAVGGDLLRQVPIEAAGHRESAEAHLDGQLPCAGHGEVALVGAVADGSRATLLRLASSDTHQRKACVSRRSLNARTPRNREAGHRSRVSW